MEKESTEEVVKDSRKVSFSRRVAGWKEDAVWLNPLVAVKILVNPHILAMVRITLFLSKFRCPSVVRRVSILLSFSCRRIQSWSRWRILSLLATTSPTQHFSERYTSLPVRTLLASPIHIADSSDRSRKCRLIANLRSLGRLRPPHLAAQKRILQTGRSTQSRPRRFRIRTSRISIDIRLDRRKGRGESWIGIGDCVSVLQRGRIDVGSDADEYVLRRCTSPLSRCRTASDSSSLLYCRRFGADDLWN